MASETPAARKPARAPVRRKGWKSDMLLGAMGVALGLGCAYFPWYIFKNQENFGPPVVRFEGGNPGAAPAGMAPTTGAPTPLSVTEVPIMELDLFATGTVPGGGEDDGPDDTEAAAEQPFPSVPPPFRVVHVTNGRAMIEDDAGLWLVQRGSTLPDDSRVTAIEKRGDDWVVVTDGERVLRVGR